jgi:ribosome-associated protein
MTESDIEIDDLPSRSQLKRDSQELRDMGAQLVQMPNAHLDKIAMDNTLLAAIKEARRLKSNDARRRQIQYIGKLMRNMDLTEIRHSVEKLNHQSQTFRQHFANVRAVARSTY